MGLAHFLQRRSDRAAAQLLASLHEVPNYPTTLSVSRVLLAHLGLLDDARELVARFRIEPPSKWQVTFTVSPSLPVDHLQD
jgi:hypothetical protein